MCTRKGIEKLIKKEISKRITTQNGFKLFESVSKIAIIDEPFAIENELLTQSLKMKRNQIAKQYEDVIEAMYQ